MKPANKFAIGFVVGVLLLGPAVFFTTFITGVTLFVGAWDASFPTWMKVCAMFGPLLIWAEIRLSSFVLDWITEP